MSGRTILDLVAVLNATRLVAKKHVLLRKNQIELYSRSSSLAEAVCNQAEKVLNPVKLAPDNGSNPNDSISRRTRAKGLKNNENSREPSTASNAEHTSASSISFQKQGPHMNEGINKVSENTSLSELAKVTNDVQQEATEKIIADEKKHLKSTSVHAKHGGNSGDPKVMKDQSEQLLIPKEINTNLFHSQRVARMLGGKIQGNLKSNLEPRTSVKAPIDLEDFATSRVDHSLLTTSKTSETQVQRGKTTSPTTNTNSKDLKETTTYEAPPHASKNLRESEVPSSRISRLWNYGGLAAGMLGGVVSESIRRAASGGKSEGSYLLTAGNMDRLVAKLSRMRGAALKLGQMLSFQDSKVIPASVQEVLQRVQDHADYMPSYQRDQVLIENLGPGWRDLFSSFDETPLAAASIGQVHRAILKSNGIPVAVKIQYPGVANSIDSDLNNLKVLLMASKLLPKGLYLDKTIDNARTELAWECDYEREAECGRRFKHLLHDESDVLVPEFYAEASGRQVLTMEFMNGIGITKIKGLTQDQKDWIGTQVLRLCLREITEFKFMQTDPNWTNFLFNTETQKLELLDFGASREYPVDFVTKYSQLLAAASKSDKSSIRDISISLGYLTGYESKKMLDAHVTSILTLAEPFLETSPSVYDFRDQTITDRVRELIPVMMRERLAPPPEETYSLHRKLSGAFLLCARLGSRVPCRKLFEGSFSRSQLL
ncbi:Bgt-42 [Blumeria graminis f. sp. tritici]|uniref:Bgt-42 n=2 Tax=Blumeria graminis f. sp. tritici TaxID=62690 RepID=A0A061HS98_BLUGR|nr:hypothetical protein BGT96224_42 [Blumeria graminis f. sp. tritici 96224]VDB86190.1 Bgt-42 [Blumeria graminis f. sp. tritici]